MNITIEEARHLSVLASGFQKRSTDNPDESDIAQILKKLGCIQLDTINVAARSHYIIPWSRLGEYDIDAIDATIHPNVDAFEYWAHAAAFVDIELLPFFQSRMDWYRNLIERGDHPWMIENRDLVRHVRESIAKHGPVTSGFFQRPESHKPVDPWEWYGGKPTTRAIDMLWRSGEVLVQKRVKFRRYFDIADRVVPGFSQIDRPDPLEERLTLALRATQATGVMHPSWLNDYFRTRWGVRGDDGLAPEQLLEVLAERDEAQRIENDTLGHLYVARSNLDLLGRIVSGDRSEATSLLSPFDNLIWDRQRARELFNFEYKIEVYTPEANRIYGYYSMPILYKGELIGRLDPKADRKNGVLRVRSLHMETGTRPNPEMAEALQQTLESFARFTGTECVSIENLPDDMKKLLPREFSAMV